MKKLALTILLFVTHVAVNAQLLPSPSWSITQNAALSFPLAGVRFLDAVDDNTLWLIGYDGVNYKRNYNYWSKSTNGGATFTSGVIWQSTVTPLIGDTSTWVIANLEGVNGNIAWLAARNKHGFAKGVVFNTIDGGVTWSAKNSTEMFSDTTSYLNFVSFVTPSTGIAVGDPLYGEFEIWRTTDAGETWDTIPKQNISDTIFGEYGVTNVYAKYGAAYYWFGTGKNRIYNSVDTGLTWSVCAPLVSVNGTPSGINGIAFADSLNGLAWASVWNGTSYVAAIWNTADGGQTWSEIPSVDSNFGTSDFCAIPGTGWYASCNNTYGNSIISLSRDNGVTWEDWGGTKNIQYLQVDFSSSTTGWAGSFSSATTASVGGIYKYCGPNLTIGVKENEIMDPDVNLYPNPAKEKIHLEINDAGPHRYLIADLIGNVVLKSQMPANNETDIDISSLNKGFYFLSIEADQKKIIRKIVKE